ncbi:MAG: serine hydrolase domain-containing protein [Acetatifactor sp.]
MYNYKDTMDKLLMREVSENRVKGVSALVLHKGKEIYFNAFGMADVARGILMKRDTIIHLYSMSKPITAAAVMILAERGELDLQDPVSLFLPCFRNQTVWKNDREVPVEREVTVYDLLNMTSGITYPDESTEPGRRMKQLVEKFVARREAGERVDTMEYMKGIASVPLVFQPGEHWMYGFSADVLGGIVEAVSGVTYGEFLRRELFEPLEMKDTGFFVPEAKKNRFACSYEVTEDGRFLPHTGSHLGEYYGEDVAFESGGAGMVSTLDDYAHFATMLVNKGLYGKKRILGCRTVEFMAQNHLTEAQAVDLNWDSLRGYGYGCLMRVLQDGGKAGSNATPGEFGWDGWTGNYVSIDFKEELVFLYFIQRCDSGTTPIVRKLRMVTYGALE